MSDAQAIKDAFSSHRLTGDFSSAANRSMSRAVLAVIESELA